MRVFIAIDIDEEIKKGLKDLHIRLQKECSLDSKAVKWVRPEQIHLTLKFLGEARDKEIVDICNITKNVAGRYEKFNLNVESVGFFGGSSARVLWVGTDSIGDELGMLQKDLDNELYAAGWPGEKRKFSGHLTLCRIKNSQVGIELAKAAEKYKDFKLGSTSVDSVTVYQSQLTSVGPTYTVLGNYNLK